MTFKTVWALCFGIFVGVLVLAWLDGRSYDKDLEEQHIEETGYTWKEIE